MKRSRFDFNCGITREACSDGFLHLAGADAFGADICAGRRAFHHDADLLQVRVEPAARGTVGVAAIIAVTGLFPADCAYF